MSDAVVVVVSRVGCFVVVSRGKSVSWSKSVLYSFDKSKMMLLFNSEPAQEVVLPIILLSSFRWNLRSCSCSYFHRVDFVPERREEIVSKCSSNIIWNYGLM